MTRIQFGTDGWRGVVNDDFTLDNVRVVAQAIAEYIKSLSFPKQELAVGYDGRTLSPNRPPRLRRSWREMASRLY